MKTIKTIELIEWLWGTCDNRKCVGQRCPDICKESEIDIDYVIKHLEKVKEDIDG